MRLVPRIYILLGLICIFLGYENFSYIETDDRTGEPLQVEEHSNNECTKILKDMNDFQSKDKVKSTLAVPQGGHDFQSVRDDWTTRESQLLLNGADQRFLDNINDHINNYYQSNFAKKDPPTDPTLAAKEGVSPDGTPAPAAANANSSEASAKSNLKFTRINVVKYELSKDSYFNFIADPGNARLNYSQMFTANTKFGVEHRTSDNMTQMFFNYQW